jgi:hypothetical protein
MVLDLVGSKDGLLIVEDWMLSSSSNAVCHESVSTGEGGIPSYTLTLKFVRF